MQHTTACSAQAVLSAPNTRAHDRYITKLKFKLLSDVIFDTLRAFPTESPIPYTAPLLKLAISPNHLLDYLYHLTPEAAIYILVEMSHIISLSLSHSCSHPHL